MEDIKDHQVNYAYYYIEAKRNRGSCIIGYKCSLKQL